MLSTQQTGDDLPTITVGQALLILLDKYKNAPDQQKIVTLCLLYLTGENDDEMKEALAIFIKDEALKSYRISYEMHDIQEDPTRRYFETCLAFYMLKDALQQLDQVDLELFYQILSAMIPEQIMQISAGKILTSTLAGENKEPNELIVNEFNDLISKLKSDQYYVAFAEQKPKLLLFAQCLFLAWFNAKIHALPINIYGQGHYADKGTQQKLSELNLKHTNGNASNYGNMKSYMPRAQDSVANLDMVDNHKPYINLPAKSFPGGQHNDSGFFPFVRGPDRFHFKENNPWVQENFSKLVHPFGTGISGTMLVQLRIFKFLQEKNLLPFNDEAKFKNYIKCFMSLMLYHLGGHTFFEYMSPLSLKEVQEAFSFMPNFNEMNMKNVLFRDNKTAFDKAIADTTAYNKHHLQKLNLHKFLRSTFFAKKMTPLDAAIESNLQICAALCQAEKLPTGVMLDIQEKLRKEMAAASPSKITKFDVEKIKAFITSNTPAKLITNQPLKHVLPPESEPVFKKSRKNGTT